MKPRGYDGPDLNLSFKNFTNKEELFDYISREDYMQAGGTEGICYGFQLSKHGGKKSWEFNLFINDQKEMVGLYNMVYPTRNPAYNPLQTEPKM